MYYGKQNIKSCKSIPAYILRPAGVLSQTAMKFKSDITIECGEKKIVAKSVLNVMAAGIKCGTEINVVCDGEDEEEALKALSERRIEERFRRGIKSVVFFETAGS